MGKRNLPSAKGGQRKSNSEGQRRLIAALSLRHLPALLLVISLALNVTLFVSRSSSGEPVPTAPVRATYPYLAQRILNSKPNEPLINFVPLRSSVQGYAQKTGHRIGLFFQYLPTGITVAVNPDEPFVSASLLKLPTVMKVYKMIEEGKFRKTNMLELTPEVFDSVYGTLWSKGIGAHVTVDEALAYSLRESDNTAHRMLYSISRGRPDDIYSYLDVKLETVEGLTAISARSYSSILRSLYFSAYLTLEHSNEVLAHLTHATAGEILRADIPSEIPVAQKIGVYGPPNSNSRAYSFCGIFYVPLRPYTLCIMSSTDPDNAIREVGELSSMVYHFVAEYEGEGIPMS